MARTSKLLYLTGNHVIYRCTTTDAINKDNKLKPDTFASKLLSVRDTDTMLDFITGKECFEYARQYATRKTSYTVWRDSKADWYRIFPNAKYTEADIVSDKLRDRCFVRYMESFIVDNENDWIESLYERGCGSYILRLSDLWELRDALCYFLTLCAIANGVSDSYVDIDGNITPLWPEWLHKCMDDSGIVSLPTAGMDDDGKTVCAEMLSCESAPRLAFWNDYFRINESDFPFYGNENEGFGADGVYSFLPEKVMRKNEAIRFACGRLASMFMGNINSNIIVQYDFVNARFFEPEMKGSNSLLSRVWMWAVEIARENKVTLCANCSRPIRDNNKKVFCDVKCKNAFHNAKRKPIS